MFDIPKPVKLLSFILGLVKDIKDSIILDFFSGSFTTADAVMQANMADGFLIACFDENVTEETIKEIALKKPYYFVMRDSYMANGSVATNFEQIFATYSPNTVRKVL